MQSMTLNASAKRMAQSLNNKPFYDKIFTCIWVLQGAKQDDYLTGPTLYIYECSWTLKERGSVLYYYMEIGNYGKQNKR